MEGSDRCVNRIASYKPAHTRSFWKRPPSYSSYTPSQDLSVAYVGSSSLLFLQQHSEVEQAEKECLAQSHLETFMTN